jgi:hypothetical protein
VVADQQPHLIEALARQGTAHRRKHLRRGLRAVEQVPKHDQLLDPELVRAITRGAQCGDDKATPGVEPDHDIAPEPAVVPDVKVCEEGDAHDYDTRASRLRPFSVMR